MMKGIEKSKGKKGEAIRILGYRSIRKSEYQKKFV